VEVDLELVDELLGVLYVHLVRRVSGTHKHLSMKRTCWSKTVSPSVVDQYVHLPFGFEGLDIVNQVVPLASEPAGT
jgi:hypothetical protein